MSQKNVQNDACPACKKPWLTHHVFDKFMANKKLEWDRFRVHVSQFEIDRYLPML